MLRKPQTRQGRERYALRMETAEPLSAEQNRSRIKVRPFHSSKMPRYSARCNKRLTSELVLEQDCRLIRKVFVRPQ